VKFVSQALAAQCATAKFNFDEHVFRTARAIVPTGLSNSEPFGTQGCVSQADLAAAKSPGRFWP
jgi:hypothetical protein